MTTKRRYLPALLSLGLLAGAIPFSPSHAQTTATSQVVTLTCTGTPCPYGSSVSGHAVVWPDSTGATNVRLGYTASKRGYLPASVANGTTIKITSGVASLFAGLPQATDHRQLTTITPGGVFEVTGLAAGEVLSVQGSSSFSYVLTLPPSNPPPPPSGMASEFLTGTCTGSPCPWGPTVSGHALVWPASAQASSTRLGYTIAKPIYLPASRANTAIVWINSGSATFYAEQPSVQSNRVLATVGAGQFYVVTGLASTEVLSVQSTAPFTYQISLPEPPPPPPSAPGSSNSEFLTGTCTGTPCPWGSSVSGHVLAWPASTHALNTRLGYTLPKGIYLPASRANTAIVWINSGSATLYAGRPSELSHRALATLSVGQYYEVKGLGTNEVLSVQSSAPFSYSIALPDPPADEPGELATVVKAYWRCNTPGCTDPDWVAGAVGFPSWSAYATNARTGSQSRTVYTENGQLLYTYMGAWANGCDITVVSGMILVIEWQRGSNSWRETYLSPGQRHVIDLISPENGAQIEGLEGSTVLLRSCTPQPIN